MNISKTNKNSIIPFLLLLPLLLGVMAFFAVPLIITVVYSVTVGTGLNNFVGLINYAELLSSSYFRLACYNTARFLLVGIPLVMIISFNLAVQIQKHTLGRLFKSIILFPYIVPISALVMFIQVFFNTNGVANHILNAVGLNSVNWTESSYAFIIAIMLYIWKNCGFNIVLILVALNTIPKEIYDAAYVDGASFFQIKLHIILPMIYNNMFFVIIISIINSFKTYREIFLLGGKHPHESIYMIQHFINNNFENINYQRLSVAAIMLMIVICILLFLLYHIKYIKQKEITYEI